MTRNNFDAIRLALALIVVLAHAATLSGSEVLRLHLLPYFSADFAVKGFFAISGFLVIRSYMHSHSIADFAERRIRRIYPAYLTTILICFALGTLITEIEIKSFIFSEATFRYLLFNILMLNFIEPSLLGVFHDNDYRAMNGSLWSIREEMALYCLVPFIYFLFINFEKK